MMLLLPCRRARAGGYGGVVVNAAVAAALELGEMGVVVVDDAAAAVAAVYELGDMGGVVVDAAAATAVAAMLELGRWEVS